MHEGRSAMRTLLPLLLIGCGGSSSHPAEVAAPQQVAPSAAPDAVSSASAHSAAPAAAALASDAVAVELFGKGFRSVEFRVATVLRKAPDAAADQVGVIGRGARAGVQRAEAGGRG